MVGALGDDASGIPNCAEAVERPLAGAPMAVLDKLEPMASSQKLNPLQRSGVILAHKASLRGGGSLRRVNRKLNISYRMLGLGAVFERKPNEDAIASTSSIPVACLVANMSALRPLRGASRILTSRFSCTSLPAIRTRAVS